MRYIKKNKNGKKFYLHGRGNLFYFASKVNHNNIITEKEEILRFKREYKVKEYKGLLYVVKK